MTYVGELGWELLVPMAEAPAVLDAVRSGGAVDAGYLAIEALRLEKGYRAFGRELTPVVTPRSRPVWCSPRPKGDKDFLGRAGAREPAVPDPDASSPSCSRTPTRCCGAASSCSATARCAAR